MSDFQDKLNAILSDPDAMAQVMNLAQSLGGGLSGSAPPQENSTDTGTHHPHSEDAPSFSASGGIGDLLGQIDPSLIQRLLPLLGDLNQSGSDDRLQLLYALRPFLKPERREKVERAVKTAKLIHLGKKFLSTMGDPYV